MLYAGYYNLSQAEKNSVPSSRPVFQETVPAEKSTPPSSSKSQRIKSGLKRALEELRPTTKALTPAGIYAPVIKKDRPFIRKDGNESCTSSNVELIKA
jgi:hypothetical protein